MRQLALSGARAALLAGPTVLAFFAGGYFDGPREWAGLVAWALVAVAAIAAGRPWPRGWSAWLAPSGLALLAAWTLASIGWAPIAGSAYHAGQIVVVYLGVILAAVALLRERSAQRLVEPVLATGALVVIGYGMSERLLPGLLHFSRSITAQGRLEQPLTYWNAMGELAALGLVLAARLAGDESRPARLRSAAAAACAPLGLGLYLSVSRGALFAGAAGLLVLVVVARRRAQLDSVLVALGAGVLASVAAAPFHAVTSLAGARGVRERDGAIMLVLLVAVAVAAGLAQTRLIRRRREGPLHLPRRASWMAVALVGAGLAVAIALGSHEKTGQAISPGATRYTTLVSNRYAYWRVAFRAFRAEPVRGVGAGGWAVYWLRYRTVLEGAQDAHSLELQTLAELGLVGLALLAAFLAGIGLAARAALRAAPVLAAGPIAGVVVWVVHSPLDWDWQMPALTAVAVILIGELIAIGLAPQRQRVELAGVSERDQEHGGIPA